MEDLEEFMEFARRQCEQEKQKEAEKPWVDQLKRWSFWTQFYNSIYGMFPRLLHPNIKGPSKDAPIVVDPRITFELPNCTPFDAVLICDSNGDAHLASKPYCVYTGGIEPVRVEPIYVAIAMSEDQFRKTTVDSTKKSDKTSTDLTCILVNGGPIEVMRMRQLGVPAISLMNLIELNPIELAGVLAGLKIQRKTT